MGVGRLRVDRFPRGSKYPNSRVLGPKIHTLNGCWSLKPYYLGTWTLSGFFRVYRFGLGYVDNAVLCVRGWAFVSVGLRSLLFLRSDGTWSMGLARSPYDARGLGDYQTLYPTLIHLNPQTLKVLMPNPHKSSSLTLIHTKPETPKPSSPNPRVQGTLLTGDSLDLCWQKHCGGTAIAQP